MIHPATIECRRIEPHLRERAQAFAAFVAAAHGIADDPALSAERRHALLTALEADAPNDHARRLLQAFEKDVATERYRSWSELLAYCRFGAAPAGRFLAELHGEDEDAAAALEALYTARALLSRLQSCKDDFTRHGRVYLPGDWLRRAGVAPADLAARAANPALRGVFAQLLDRADRLVTQARAGIPAIGNANLRRESALAAAAAVRLAAKLRRRDPVARRVALNAVERAAAALAGRLRR